MQRDLLKGIVVVVILASAIMFALVGIQGAWLSEPPPAAAFAPEVPVASVGWLPSRSHIVVLSAPTESKPGVMVAHEPL